MITYYLHNGIESSGPFGLEELKNKKITRTTPVWCEGMEDWKPAGEIEELKSILHVIPPPLRNAVTTPPIQSPEKKRVNPMILGINRKVFFMIFGFLLLTIGTVIFNVLQENRRAEFEAKNNKTERNNQQFKLQQAEIEEQKNLIAEQELRDAERIKKERKLEINAKLVEIQKTIIEKHTYYEDAKNKLTEATAFKILRTTDERNEEISLIQNDIQYWKKEIEKLENEMNLLNLELERLH
jgi:cell division protein FtsB